MSDAAIQLGESTVKLLAEIDRLRAENEELEAARKLHAGGHVACEKECERLRVEGKEWRDLAFEHLLNVAIPLGQENVRLRAENETLRGECNGLQASMDEQARRFAATAFTASEAEYLRRYFGFKRRDESICSVDYGAMFAKLDRIAHPEPQEGK